MQGAMGGSMDGGKSGIRDEVHCIHGVLRTGVFPMLAIETFSFL